MAGKKGGRPRVEPALARTVQVGFRMTVDEYVEAETKAEAMGMSVGEWTRESSIRRKLPPQRAPALNREVWGRLGKTLGGINTVAQRAGAGELDGWTDEDRESFRELRDQVKALRAELLNGNSK